ncbi:sugar-binding transcriptional regulator [Agromyces atrinae]|uniref:Deoxyribonucleoside regulator n=1 Tax=Agromyces atrinae TaxID=592376 RepID=A0A4Q2M839_9MICO|nr:sugar-binding domain-containing protein [Agromyces atrinae]MCI2958985.1 sugar-binding transcriptional regulator [Agromyces atrinae]NYD65788.1 deoxyribonucleoside regulator [Agromyces atrinae]RXZ86141.1 sugar-binding transcriptional regulator [Agromyces atrinae]
MGENDELLSIRAAELYYEEDKTQDEIGQVLRLTRWKVGRLLSQAKANGFIRIEIVHPRARRLPLERRLRDERGLVDAIVVSGAGVESAEELQARTAQAAADYLTTLRPVPRTLGVSWGRTLHEVSQHLRKGWATGVNVVQINGGVSLNRRSGTAASTAVTIAQKAGGQATLLPSPAILERLETKNAIESDRVVAGVLDLARSANAYLFSAGAADHSSVHLESGYLSPADVDELVRKGAVGDVVGRYIDSDGNIVDPSLDGRTVGLTLDELRTADRCIAVISGRSKHPVANAVVGSRLCSVLVTDEETALHLLDA